MTLVRFHVDFLKPTHPAVTTTALVDHPTDPVTTDRASSRAGVSSGVARLLVVAHHVEQMIATHRLPDYVTAARALGLLQPRLAQALRLLVLAPDIQERILSGEGGWSENELQPAIRVADWEHQRRLLSEGGP